MRPPRARLANLVRALDRGNLLVARAIAADLDHVPLREALRITELIADQHPSMFERAALRWLERFCAEAAEGPDEVADAAASLSGLGRGESEARVRLRATVGLGPPPA